MSDTFMNSEAEFRERAGGNDISFPRNKFPTYQPSTLMYIYAGAQREAISRREIALAYKTRRPRLFTYSSVLAAGV